MMLAWLVNTVIRFILHILLRIDSSELAKVPQKGPLLAVANHINFLDAPVLITHLQPRPVTGLVKRESWDNPAMAFLFNVWGGIPIDRSIADFAAFNEAKMALNEGKILAVAPEGTRSNDGCLIRGKPGITILASKTDVPILPIVYYGHEDFRANIRKLKRTRMTIKVGKPFKINLHGDQKNKEVVQAATDAIMLEIADLMPKKYHGVYAGMNIDREKYIQHLDSSFREHVPESFREQFTQA
jgi:1-acyl-sn-glycerol-3-phosphate acyltransferase